MGVRERFVQEVLSSEADRMLRRQGARISEVTMSRSGRLLHGREVSVSGGAELDGKLTLTHPVYERFLDIRRRGASGRRSNRRIHNRFVFGAYSSIAERLMYGLTEDVAARIRAELDGAGD